MTLPSSGALDYNSIRAEFGAPSANVYISLFNRTGAYVYNVPANANIPTSGSAQISVSNFYGARGKTDYAAGTGAAFSVGGKLPVTYYGTGGPSLPSMSDTSFLQGGSSKTLTAFYYQDTSIWDSMIAVCSPGSWSGTVSCYRNDNGSNFVNIPISNGSYASYPGGWGGPGGTTYNEQYIANNSPPGYNVLNTGTMNIYKGF